MRLLRPPRRAAAESIIPMINVVFLLLIFFLMVAEIAPPDPVKVTPPAVPGGDTRTRGLTLVLGPDGTPAFEGATGPAALAALGAKLATAPGPVRLRADKAAPAVALARLMPQLSALGAREIRLETVPK